MHIPIRIAARLLLGCAVAAAPAFAVAQAAPAKPAVGTQMTPSATYDKLLSGMEKEFVDAAEAMPEDKFNFSPTQGEFKGVRTFGGQVKHVAEANYYFFGASEADTKAKGDALKNLKTKAEIVQALKDSFTQAHTYVDSITADNAFIQTDNGTRAGQAAFGLAHFMDHYGQMVEYLRMNGIVPPASRGGNM